MSAGTPSLNILMRKAQEAIKQRQRSHGPVRLRPWVIFYEDQSDVDRQYIQIEARRLNPFCVFAVSFENGGPGDSVRKPFTV